MRTKTQRVGMLTRRLREVVLEHGEMYMQYLRAEDESQLDELSALDEIIEWLHNRIEELRGWKEV